MPPLARPTPPGTAPASPAAENSPPRRWPEPEPHPGPLAATLPTPDASTSPRWPSAARRGTPLAPPENPTACDSSPTPHRRSTDRPRGPRTAGPTAAPIPPRPTSHTATTPAVSAGRSGSARHALHRPNLLIQHRHVQPRHILPHQTRRMVLRQQLVQRCRTQDHLTAVRPLHPRHTRRRRGRRRGQARRQGEQGFLAGFRSRLVRGCVRTHGLSFSALHFRCPEISGPDS